MISKKQHTTLHKKVDNSYNNIASKFSASRNRPWIEFDLYRNFVSRADKLLDIGCGNGRLLLHLDDLDLKYTGLDISSEMIEEAKLNLSQTQSKKTFVHSSFVAKEQDLALKPESFDAIFAVASFHHLHGLANRRQFLANVYKYLKPNSTACVSVWNLWQKKYLPNFLTAFLTHPWRFNDINVKFGQTPRYYHAFMIWELKLLLWLSPFKSYELVFVDKKGYKCSRKDCHNIILVLNK